MAQKFATSATTDADEALHHLLQQILNLSPSPMLLMERVNTRPCVYANGAAIHYLLPEEEPKDAATNAQMLNHQLRLWQSAMLDKNGIPVPYEERPGVRLIRGEEFRALELQWIHPKTHHKHYVYVYGCLIPPNYGLLSFMDVTTCIMHLEHMNNSLLTKEEFHRQTSHQLRTPLTRILLTVQSLLRKLRTGSVPTEAWQEKLTVAEQSALELVRMLDEILEP